MTKICKVCGHSKCYHFKNDWVIVGDKKHGCELCFHADHAEQEEYPNRKIPKWFKMLSFHEFKEVIPENKYLFMSVGWRGRQKSIASHCQMFGHTILTPRGACHTCSSRKLPRLKRQKDGLIFYIELDEIGLYQDMKRNSRGKFKK